MTRVISDDLFLQGNLILSVSSQTIASGVITPTTTLINLDTEGAAATDDLTTITAGQQGQLIILKSTSDSRDITIKDGTGNIDCGGDRVLDRVQDTFMAVFVGSSWRELSFANNT